MASHRRYTPPTASVPEVKIDGVETAPDLAVSVTLPDDATQYEQQIPEHDEAAAALKRQIAALDQSEQLQRQHQERQHAHTHAMNQLAEHASRAAADQGHQPGTDAHLNRAREIFSNYLRDQAGAQQAANTPPVAPQPIPRPSLAPLPQEPPPPVSHYSAPVSRETYSASGQRPSTSRITLSKEEKDMARVAGVSELEYAKQKQRLIEEKNSGNYGEHRYR